MLPPELINKWELPDTHNDTAKEKRFSFTLARQLGMTVAELEQRMTYSEWREWLALMAVEASERDQK